MICGISCDKKHRISCFCSRDDCPMLYSVGMTWSLGRLLYYCFYLSSKRTFTLKLYVILPMLITGDETVSSLATASSSTMLARAL